MYLLELGGEDDAFAARETRNAASDVDRIAPGLAVAPAIAPDRVRGLAYTHRASELVGRTDAEPAAARQLLEAAPIDREGSVAVRATDVRGSTGVDTAAVERSLGQVLVDRGFAVDLESPDHVLRACFSRGAIDRTEGRSDPAAGSHEERTGEEGSVDGERNGDRRCSVCALGWLVAESVREFGDRAPTDKPFFQPGSMEPLLARAISNLAGAGPGERVLDPMCGTGGVLVEAGLLGADVVGTDAQAKMVVGARENLRDGLAPGARTTGGTDAGSWVVARADATALPIADDAVDAVVFDAPYGRQSRVETHRLADLVAGALEEARRVADRAVVVGDRDRTDEVLATGWTVEAAFERRVHRSLTRHVLVLE